MNDIVQRWRLVLGTGAQETTSCVLGGRKQRMDKALAALYGESDKRERRGGLGTSAPEVSTWLGDIREFFPQSVVQIMQPRSSASISPVYSRRRKCWQTLYRMCIWLRP